MRSHNQTLLTGPSVCKSLTGTCVRGKAEGRRVRADTSVRRPHRFARNVEYKLPRRFRQPQSLSSPSVRRKWEFGNNKQLESVEKKCLLAANDRREL